MMATSAMTENILGPLIAIKNFHGAKSWAIVLTAESIGYLFGSLIGMKISLRFPMRAVALLIATLSLFSWSLAKPSPLYLIAAAAFIWGIALDLLMSLWSTTLARSVPREALSRVSSYDALGSFLLRPVGLMIAAPLAIHFGYSKTLGAIGLVSLLVALAMVAVPEVRNMQLADAPPIAGNVN
jgi:MFS family permease